MPNDTTAWVHLVAETLELRKGKYEIRETIKEQSNMKLNDPQFDIQLTIALKMALFSGASRVPK